jgi:hypothetical protein
MLKFEKNLSMFAIFEAFAYFLATKKGETLFGKK